MVGSVVDTAVTSSALRMLQTTMARNESQNADPLGVRAWGLGGGGVEEGVEGMLPAVVLGLVVMFTWERGVEDRAMQAADGGREESSKGRGKEAGKQSGSSVCAWEWHILFLRQCLCRARCYPAPICFY